MTDCPECFDGRVSTGQVGMQRDGQPLVCPSCQGTGDSEAVIQRAVIRLYEDVGCVVALTNQSYRRGGRRNPGTAGIPDLYVFPPAGAPWWHETKRPGGKQSPAQVAWQSRCVARDVDYILGGEEEADAQIAVRLSMLDAYGISIWEHDGDTRDRTDPNSEALRQAHARNRETKRRIAAAAKRAK